MLIVHVHIHVKPDRVDDFKRATIDNASKSVLEPGAARFDFIQQHDDPTRFLLVEIYRTTDDPAKHKETDHYKIWRDSVAEMMVEPRASVKFRNIFPDDEGWG